MAALDHGGKPLNFSNAGVIGFNNLGNTCFINSSLHLLLHCRPLIENILNVEHTAPNHPCDGVFRQISQLNRLPTRADLLRATVERFRDNVLDQRDILQSSPGLVRAVSNQRLPALSSDAKQQTTELNRYRDFQLEDCEQQMARVALYDEFRQLAQTYWSNTKPSSASPVSIVRALCHVNAMFSGSVVDSVLSGVSQSASLFSQGGSEQHDAEELLSTMIESINELVESRKLYTDSDHFQSLFGAGDEEPGPLMLPSFLYSCCNALRSTLGDAPQGPSLRAPWPSEPVASSSPLSIQQQAKQAPTFVSQSPLDHLFSCQFRQSIRCDNDHEIVSNSSHRMWPVHLPSDEQLSHAQQERGFSGWCLSCPPPPPTL